MSHENYPMQSILFARIEGRNEDGSDLLGQPRLIGSISPLEGREKEAGVMRCDLTPMERGVYFVIRSDEKKSDGRQQHRPHRERGR